MIFSRNLIIFHIFFKLFIALLAHLMMTKGGGLSTNSLSFKGSFSRNVVVFVCFLFCFHASNY